MQYISFKTLRQQKFSLSGTCPTDAKPKQITKRQRYIYKVLYRYNTDGINRHMLNLTLDVSIFKNGLSCVVS